MLTSKRDLAVMECLSFRPVCNADDGGCAEVLGQKFHQLILARRIERRCRLIENNDVRPMKQDTSECELLLFAGRQYLVARRVLFNAVDQMAKANKFKRLPKLIDIFIFI